MTVKQNLTIDDIARELGVSKTTVSRAISGKGRISAATRQRVQEYIEAHNYRPSAAAKGLAESRTYNLGLVLPRSFIQLDLPYIRKSMNAICEEAFLRDYNILLCLSTDANPGFLRRTLDNRKVDGVILARTVADDVLVEILAERGIPFATIGSLSQGNQGKALVEADHDQVGGCHAFTKAFLKNAPGKTAILGNDMQYVVNQSRLAGFRQAAVELDLAPEDVITATGLCSAELCADRVDALLKQGVRNIVTMDEDICRWVLHRLDELGLTIPGDIRVGSLYDSEDLACHIPPIPALQFDAAELGRVTCKELLHAMHEESYDPKPLLGYRVLLRENI